MEAASVGGLFHFNQACNVAFWHLADNLTASPFVRFWTKADNGRFWPAMVCPLWYKADMPASEGKGRVSNLAFSLSLLRTARTAGIDLPSDLPIRGRQHPGGTA
jgi:hypothetical protein